VTGVRGEVRESGVGRGLVVTLGYGVCEKLAA